MRVTVYVYVQIKVVIHDLIAANRGIKRRYQTRAIWNTYIISIFFASNNSYFPAITALRKDAVNKRSCPNDEIVVSKVNVYKNGLVWESVRNDCLSKFRLTEVLNDFNWCTELSKRQEEYPASNEERCKERTYTLFPRISLTKTSCLR